MLLTLRLTFLTVVFFSLGCSLDASLKSEQLSKDPLFANILTGSSVVTLKTMATPFEAEPTPSLIIKNVDPLKAIALYSDSECKNVAVNSTDHLESQGADWVELKAPNQTLNIKYTYYAYFHNGCQKVAEHTYKKVVSAHFGNGAQGLILSDNSMLMFGQSDWGAQANHLNVQTKDIVKTARSAYATAAVKSDGTTYFWGQDNSNNYYDEETPFAIPVEDIYGSSYGSSSSGFTILGKNQKIYSVSRTSNVTSPDEPLDNSYSYKKMFNFNDEVCGLTTTDSVVCSAGDPSPGDNNNIKSVYFHKFVVIYAHAAIKNDGSVIAWGSSGYGGDLSSVVPTPTNIEYIVSTDNGFAAYSEVDRRAYVWGSKLPGVHAAALTSTVKKVVSTEWSFGVLKDDGSVIVWGYAPDEPTSIASDLYNIVDLKATSRHFVALRGDGTAFYWGEGDPPRSTTNVVQVYAGEDKFTFKHGNGSFSTVDGANIVPLSDFSDLLSSPIIDVLSSPIRDTFIGINIRGEIVTAGDSGWGDDYSDKISFPSSIKEYLEAGYQTYITLKTDGTVECSGLAELGGDCSSLSSQLQNVVDIAAIGDGYSAGAIAALKSDGTAIIWGDSTYGGDASSIQSQLVNIKKIDSQIEKFLFIKDDDSVLLWSGSLDTAPPMSNYAFNSESITFLLKDKTAVSFGNASTGGNNSSVSASLTNIKQIVASSRAFAALKEDGTVICWGDSADDGGDCSALALTDIKELHSTYESWAGAFAAVSNSGQVTAWGKGWAGGDASAHAGALSSGVNQVVSNGSAFLAFKGTQVYAWGNINAGGDWTDSNGWIDSIKEIHPNKNGFAVLTNTNKAILWGRGIKSQQIAGVDKIYATETAFYLLSKINDNGEMKDHITSFGELLRLLPQSIHYMLKGSTLEVDKDRLVIKYPDGSKRKF